MRAPLPVHPCPLSRCVVTVALQKERGRVRLLPALTDEPSVYNHRDNCPGVSRISEMNTLADTVHSEFLMDGFFFLKKKEKKMADWL